VPEKEEGPPDPGEMPDPTMDPDGWKEWYARDKAATEAQHREEIDGIKGTLGADAARREASAFRQQHGMDDSEWTDFQAEMKRLQTDKDYAMKTIVERVRGRKGKVAKKAKQRKDVEEAAQGMEERPGLSATGVRAKRAPTGNIARDVMQEMEDEGVKIPDDL